MGQGPWRRWWGIPLGALVAFLGGLVVWHPPLVSQTSRYTRAQIWNWIYNDELNLVAPIPGAVEAQGTQLTEAEILNRLLVINADGSASLRGLGFLVQEVAPTTCTANLGVYFNPTTKCLYSCNATGTGWDQAAGCGGIAGTTTGLRTSATDVTSLRYGVTSTNADLVLGQHLVVLVTTGNGAKVLTLPDPGNPEAPGLYYVIIEDNTVSGSVALAPSAGATINGTAATTDPITGQGSYFQVLRAGPTAWKVYAMMPVAAGDVSTDANNTYEAGTTQDFSAATVVLPAGVGGDVSTDQANTYGAFVQDFSAATVTLPAAHVRTDQANTYGAFAQDFGAASVAIPTSAGCAPTADGGVCLDSTHGALSIGARGVNGKIGRVLTVVSPAQTLTNSTTSEQVYTSLFSLPSGGLIANKVYRITIFYTYVTDSGASSITFALQLGGVRVYYHSSAFTPANSVTRAFTVSWLIRGTAAAGASVAVQTAPQLTLADYQDSNATTQPVLLATDTALTVVPTVQYGTNTGGESMTVVWAMLEEVH